MDVTIGDDITSLTALDARRRIDGGTLTSRQLVDACLARIDQREPDVQAWEHIDHAGARALASKLDSGPASGLLHGIPFAVKDILDTYDQPSTYGSPIYRDHRAPWDAATAALARGEGGIAIGKTVTTEFANRHPGKTHNPHNLAHTPGGSSSGSAAAVADFQVPLAIGTQTGGSVIRPASYCGVYGYKPSFQLFGNAGVRTNTEQFDTVGIMARSVGDLALFKAAVAQLPYTPPRPDEISRPRIAFYGTPGWPDAEPATHQAIAQAIAALKAGGAEIFDLQLPDFFAKIGWAQKIVSGFENVRNYADELRRWPDLVSDDFKRERVAVGATLQDFREGVRLGRRARAWIDNFMTERGIDAVLTPSAPGEAPAGLHSTGVASFNHFSSHLYMPAITVPRFTGPTGLPVGIQLVGRRYEDDRLLTVAAWADNQFAAQ